MTNWDLTVREITTVDTKKGRVTVVFWGENPGDGPRRYYPKLVVKSSKCRVVMEKAMLTNVRGDPGRPYQVFYVTFQAAKVMVDNSMFDMDMWGKS